MVTAVSRDNPTAVGLMVRFGLVVAGMLSVPSLTGCAAPNRLGQSLHVERGAYEFQGEPLEYFAAMPLQSKTALPVLVFLEGDGEQCQAFSQALWQRFLTRYTGRFVLVRPRTLVNTLCAQDKDRWARLDFTHRVDELEALVPRVRSAFPRGPLFLLGHSAGAHVAQLYAERHPDQVAGLINLSGGFDELAGVLKDIAEQEGDTAAKVAAFLSEAGAMAPDSLVWNRTALFWKQMLFSGVRSLWVSYRKPCLVLHGTQDIANVPWAGVQRDGHAVTAAGGSCKLEGLEGVGHDTLSPRTFDRIDAWLESQVMGTGYFVPPTFSEGSGGTK